MRTCVMCGAIYRPTAPNNTTCSDECRRIRRNQFAARIRERSSYIATDAAGNIRYAREAVDLEALNPGMVECLSCGREFKSWDRARNRVCRRCLDKEDGC
jgi:predicted nucleic acid-binding Zn ribbon protein